MNSSAVVVRAGSRSIHAKWLSGCPARFDLIVAAYEDLPPELTSAATESIFIPGTKVAGWSRLFSDRPELLQRYEQIALMDDDLLCSACDINASFDAGRKYQLSLWQPSLSWTSYFSHAVFLNNPLFRVRYVNFIEMMCPFFSADHLGRSLPLFALGYETGIDRLWCRLRRDWRGAYAVLDDVQFEHTRPVGQNRKDQGFIGVHGEYQTVIDQMEEAVGVFFRGPVAYAGIDRNGVEIKGRFPMAVRALATLAAWRSTVNAGWFYRPVVDHVRHILTRPINNDLLDLKVIKPTFRR